MIIDSHTHIARLDNKKDFLQIKKDLLLDMEKNKVDYAVVIPDNVLNPLCADFEIAQKLIKGDPRFCLIGTLKVNEINRKSLNRIDDLFKNKIIRGFKIFPGHDPVFPTDKRWDPLYKLCVRYNFPLIIHTGINKNNPKVAKYNDPKFIVKVAKAYPGLRVIIAHYFWPKLDYCFSITNGINNIFFDISGLADPQVVEACGGIKKVRIILSKTFKRRPESLIFGSDWPVGKTRDHKKLIESLYLTQKDKERVFYYNSKKIFRIPK